MAYMLNMFDLEKGFNKNESATAVVLKSGW